MQRPAYQGTVVAAVRSIAITALVLLSSLPTTPCSAQISNARSAAWDRYSQASEALSTCRMRGRAPPPCVAEKAASLAAEARYRAEIGAAQATGRP
jgi:hypothetical protein